MINQLEDEENCTSDYLKWEEFFEMKMFKERLREDKNKKNVKRFRNQRSLADMNQRYIRR